MLRLTEFQHDLLEEAVQDYVNSLPRPVTLAWVVEILIQDSKERTEFLVSLLDTRRSKEESAAGLADATRTQIILDATERLKIIEEIAIAVAPRVAVSDITPFADADGNLTKP